MIQLRFDEPIERSVCVYYCDRLADYWFILRSKQKRHHYSIRCMGSDILWLFLVDETRCGDPEQPLSSTVERQSADKVMYACVKGFKMEGGEAERTCLPNGRWSGQPPSCSGDQLFSIFYHCGGGSSNAGYFPMRAPAEFCIEREATPTSSKNQFVTLHLLLCGRKSEWQRQRGQISTWHD